jgi:hypothetical protein
MEYFVLSLPEATFLYLGLAIQTVLRQTILRHIVAVIIASVVLTLLVRHAGTARPLRPALLYGVVSLGLCILFWPDITPFGRQALPHLEATQVASYAASQYADAEVITAADTQEIPGALQGVVLETPGFRLLLKPLTDGMLALARILNTHTHRLFPTMVSMEWLLGFALTGEVTRTLADWIEGCYKPSLAQDLEFTEAITAEQLLPWGDTPVSTALATRETRPGAQAGNGYLRPGNGPLGLAFLQGATPTATIRCDVYLGAVEHTVQAWLGTLHSPAGTPLLQVFQEDLGLTPIQQGRFLIYREILRAMGGPAPAPSLAGAYSALSGINAGAGAVRGGLAALAPHGALAGAGAAVMNQFQRGVEWLTWWVGVAAWLVYWAPYIVGIQLMLLIGFFPFVFFVALIPGAQVRPLVAYFLTLAWALSSPVWFALVDLSARAAASQAPRLDDPILALLNWAPAQLYSVVVTVLGITLIPVLLALVMGGLVYSSVRSVSGLLRAA